MYTKDQGLSELTAEDLMSRDVVTIPEEMSLPAAARLLSRAQVSGAPVVDARGACVGVVSATDFLRLAQKGWPRNPLACASPLCVCSDWQMIEVEDLPDDEVRRHMTADLVTATPEAPAHELARLMLEAHVHRVIVLGAGRRPVGVVSSTDLIAAVARAGQAQAVAVGGAY